MTENVIYERLMNLASRLSDEGREDDAALVYSAAFKYASPEPRYQKAEKIHGFGHVVQTIY